MAAACAYTSGRAPPMRFPVRPLRQYAWSCRSAGVVDRLLALVAGVAGDGLRDRVLPHVVTVRELLSGPDLLPHALALGPDVRGSAARVQAARSESRGVDLGHPGGELAVLVRQCLVGVDDAGDELLEVVRRSFELGHVGCLGNDDAGSLLLVVFDELGLRFRGRR